MNTEEKRENYFKSKNKIYYKKEGEFFLNENKLNKNKQDDLTDKLTDNDFKTIISSEVQKFVNQSFDNIVVLVGAGASVIKNDLDNEFGESGLTVAKIAEKVFLELKKKKYNIGGENIDVFDLKEISKKSLYDKNMDGSITSEGVLKSDFNLEDFLSNLFAFEKFASSEDKEKVENTKKAILDIIIKATSYDYSEKFKHIKFLNVISEINKSDNKINIVTTNYDTLLEEAADKMKWTVFDGFSFSQNPQFDATLFDWNLVKDVPNVKTHENIYKKNVINLLKIHGSLTWERSKDSGNILRKQKSLVEEPLMIFPSSNKYSQSYQEPYFDLFAKFQNLIKQPNTLLITTGFSFSDNHIAEMIISAIKTNDGLATLVTNHGIDSRSKNWKAIIQLMSDSYDIAFLRATINGDLSYYLGGQIDEN